MTTRSKERTRAARTAVAWVFFLHGLCFASWVSRIPEARTAFDLSNGSLGLLLLAIAAGSMFAMPTTGAAIGAWGSLPVLRLGVVCAALGLAGAGWSLGHSLVMFAVFLGLYGVGMGIWDVTMNVEGAEVERHLGRAIMPRFHAVFSLGTMVGALGGAVLVAVGVSATLHLAGVVIIVLAGVWWTSGALLPVVKVAQEHRPSSVRAWLEPRTLLIGIVVLALAITEGTANDWLGVALVDGYGVSHAMGVAGFGVFVAAMTATRWWGVRLLDRHGRVATLWATMALAGAGVLLIVLDLHPLVAGIGIFLWGAGASLGFPVGMSAAADDPIRAASRVSVVATIGYTAFLAGPPLLGFVADRVGTLHALTVVVLLLIPAALVVPATRPQASTSR